MTGRHAELDPSARHIRVDPPHHLVGWAMVAPPADCRRPRDVPDLDDDLRRLSLESVRSRLAERRVP